MEFEDVSARIQWETRRVAAAFGVEEWDTFEYEFSWGFSGIGHDLSLVGWAVESSTGCWLGSEVGPKEVDEVQACARPIGHSYYLSCYVARNPEDPQEWFLGKCGPSPLFNELMSRGLYRLGVEDEYLMSHLPELSTHEKLELRLSMPREFWPQTWLEEERAGARPLPS